MPVLPVPHPGTSPHSPHPRCQHLQTGRIRFGEFQAWLCQLNHVWHVELLPDYCSVNFTQVHCLPVVSRIQFKIATLTHKILSTGTPSYLPSLPVAGSWVGLGGFKPTHFQKRHPWDFSQIRRIFFLGGGWGLGWERKGMSCVKLC